MSLPYNQFTYIFPPRPAHNRLYGTESFRRLQQTPGWIAELKINEQRNMIYINPEDEHDWWNRHGDRHKNYKPPKELSDELRSVLKITPGKWTVLDGGLIHAKDAAVKNTLYFWDVLVLNGQYLLGTTRDERHKMLYEILGADKVEPEDYVRKVTPRIWVSETIPQDKWDEWPRLTKISWVEGFVLKYGQGRLKPGIAEANNDAWLVRSRKITKSGHIRHG